MLHRLNMTPSVAALLYPHDRVLLAVAEVTLTEICPLVASRYKDFFMDTGCVPFILSCKIATSCPLL